MSEIPTYPDECHHGKNRYSCQHCRIVRAEEGEEEWKAAYEECFNIMWRTALQNATLNEHVTNLQTRNTELLEEVRALKRENAQLRGAQ